MKNRLFALVGITLVLISACSGADTAEIPAAGDIVVERYDLSGFDQVEVTNHSTLILTASASSVTGQATGFSSADLTRLKAAQIDVEVDGKSSLRH